jgi:hypothetical protein
VRNFTAVSMALAASGLLFGLSPAVFAQTWVETHPALADVGSRTPDKDVRADMKPDDVQLQYREARLRPDDDLKQDDDAGTKRGSLDHPANAGGESSHHE